MKWLRDLRQIKELCGGGGIATELRVLFTTEEQAIVPLTHSQSIDLYP